MRCGEGTARGRQGQVSQRAVSDRIRMLTCETENDLLFETRDLKSKGRWLHRNYIRK